MLETTVSCGNEVGKGVFWHLREQVAQRCWYHRRPEAAVGGALEEEDRCQAQRSPGGRRGESRPGRL